MFKIVINDESTNKEVILIREQLFNTDIEYYIDLTCSDTDDIWFHNKNANVPAYTFNKFLVLKNDIWNLLQKGYTKYSIGNTTTDFLPVTNLIFKPHTKGLVADGFYLKLLQKEEATLISQFGEAFCFESLLPIQFTSIELLGKENVTIESF